MIEQVMVFTLGFCTAGLLALACLPAVWRRAIRLTTRQLTRLVPLSMDEVVAERDGLRAGFAVEQRRLERKIEGLDGRRSETMIELGRRDVTIAALEDAAVLAATRIAELTGELQTVTRDLFEVQGETGTAAIVLHDLTGLLERQRWDVRAAEEKARMLRSTIDQHRATIASLETRIMGLDSRMADLDRTLDTVRAELARTVQAVVRAGAERDAAVAALTGVEGERDRLAVEGTRLDGIADEHRHRAATAIQAAAAADVTLDELRRENSNLGAQLAMQAEAAYAAMARLREAQARTAELNRRLQSLLAPSADTELGLVREMLGKVADEVLRFAEQTPEQRSRAMPDPAPIAEQASAT